MAAIGKRKADLDTPCLVLDVEIFEQNLQKMQDAADRAGKQLRPHVKTHKCTALAQRQMDCGAKGLCVAKISEAAVLVKARFDDILITAPVVTPRKIEMLLDLLGTCPSLMVVVDHPENIKLLDARLGNRGMSMGVLLDIDVGLNRTGVKPSDAPAMAKHIVSQPNLRLLGVQAYAGHVQHIQSYETRKRESRKCLQDAVRAFGDIQNYVPTCTIFSASGTGTFDIDLAVAEISELQVGSYVFMDAEYLAIGSADDENRFVTFAPALRLLTTVISTNQKGFVTVDAGLKTLYKDGGIPQVISPKDPPLEYYWFGDEHGMIIGGENSAMPPLGAVIEVVTSHCDPTVNMFDTYYLTGKDEVVGNWPIDMRGCSQ
ncbi:MAG: DSD1 family PLP-dependent enzyme [Desulfobacterales bacterium]